jgi:hypothetical protein
VKLERRGGNAFTLGLSGVELSALIAALRLAVDVLAADERTPPEALATLRALLTDYEHGVARLDRPTT